MISYGGEGLPQVVAPLPPVAVSVLHGIIPLVGIIGLALCVAFVVRWIVHSPVGAAPGSLTRPSDRGVYGTF